ncbi:MAG: InlB B-repeat-containing protein [Clostridiaceae bacterium]
MKQDFIKSFKKKMHRGISLFCVALILSTLPMVKVQAENLRLPTISPSEPYQLEHIYYDSTKSEYKSDGNGTQFVNLIHNAGGGWDSDQVAILQSGGVKASFDFKAWTGSLWSWYTGYIFILTIDGKYIHYFPTGTPVKSVYCTSYNKDFRFYESKNTWTSHQVEAMLPANTLSTSISGEILQPGNKFDNWGNRDYGWHDQAAFTNVNFIVEFVGDHYSTLVKTTPTASTIISGQTLAKSTISGGKVVSTAANANVSDPSGITGDFAWQNANQQLKSTTPVSAVFTPKYGINFLNTSCNIQVPVRAAKITLDANGGTGGSTIASGWFDSKPDALSVLPTRPRYAFKGYYSAPSGGTQYFTASGASAKNWDIAADTTLYAQWEEQGTISNISTPPAINPGNKLTLNTPTITGLTTSKEWQYSANGSNGWTGFDPSTKTFARSENGYYVRYFATSATGPIISNAVQITVNKYAPSLSLLATPKSATYSSTVVLSAALVGADNASNKIVDFYDGESLLGSSNTNSSGITAYTASADPYCHPIDLPYCPGIAG